MNMLRMCLNWRVLAGLAAVGVGIYVVAPELAGAAVPYLVLAICPVSMILMMWAMGGSHAGGRRATRETAAGLAREEQIGRLEAQKAALADRIGALEQEETPPTQDGKGR